MVYRTIAVMMLAAAAPAAASISVLGGGLGHECYVAAESASPSRANLEICNRALVEEQLTVSDRAATYVNRGIVRMQAKDLNAAIADFDTAIRAKPDTAEAYVNKGIAMIHLGNHERDAVNLLTLGLARGPAQPEIAYYVRGLANEALGQTREAFEDYSHAASLKPDWPLPAEQLERFTVKRKATAGV